MRRTAAILGTATLLAIGVAMNPSFAQAAPQPVHAGDPGYDTLLDTATAPLREEFGDGIGFQVERIDRLGHWAFVLGNMRAPGGGRPRFSGTRFADASEQGAMSDVYVALLRREDASGGEGDDVAGSPWVVVDFAIGPGDVAWLDWPQEHAAPRALFGF